MKKLCFFLALASYAVACSQNSTKMSVTTQGMEVGTATFTYRLLAGGVLEERTRIDISVGQVQLTDVEVETYDKTGRPIKHTETATQGKMVTKTVMDYGKRKLTVSKTADGKRTTKTYTYPKDGSIASGSIFWFISKKPKKGSVSTSYSFHATTSNWQKDVSTYVGDETLTVNGKGISTHHVTEGEKGSVWLDDKGLPVKMLVHTDNVDLELVRK